MSQDLSSIVVAFKVQPTLNTPESGAGATGMELLPSPGFAPQIADIVSELLSPTRMAQRPRQGSRFYNWQGETELGIDQQDDALECALGGTWAAPITLTEADLTSITITGTGTVLTFGGGDLITEGVRAGMTAHFINLSVAGNNSKYFPILDISTNGRVVAIPSGILADNTIDSAFSLVISKALFTDNPYTKRLVTLEHYLADIDRSLLGTNFRFNGVTFTMAADKKVKIGYSLGGTTLEMLDTASSPNFTSPTFTESESLVLLDGAIYFNGVKRVNLASFNFGIQAPISGLPLLSTRTSPDAYLGQFKAEGQFTGQIDDGADFDSFDAEDQVSVYLHCALQSASAPLSARYVGIYLGNMSFGSWQMPAGGEGPAIQTVKMNGGEDKRGDSLGYARTWAVISTA